MRWKEAGIIQTEELICAKAQRQEGPWPSKDLKEGAGWRKSLWAEAWVLAGQQMSGEPLRPAKSLESKFLPNTPDAPHFPLPSLFLWGLSLYHLLCNRLIDYVYFSSVSSTGLDTPWEESSLFCSPMNPQYLERCLAYQRCSLIFVEWVKSIFPLCYSNVFWHLLY